MKNELSIGKLIHDQMKEERRSAEWLANKLSCNRSNIYKIFEKPDMDIAQLMRISRILHHDFFSDLSALFEKDDSL